MNLGDLVPRPKIIAHLQCWFGPGNPGGHIDVGYDSRDLRVINHQIDLMQKIGIDGVCIDWYGAVVDPWTHQAALNWFQEIERRGGGFKAMIMLDEGIVKNSLIKKAPNDLVNDQMAVALSCFLSRPSYLLPYILEFDLALAGVDMAQLRAKFPQYQFLSKNQQYTWVEIPGGVGTLKQLYATQPIVMGSVFNGFDDSLASWGKGRKLQESQGRTWLDSWHAVPSSVKMIGIVTWNDYEEGTAIEDEVGRFA